MSCYLCSLQLISCFLLKIHDLTKSKIARKCCVAFVRTLGLVEIDTNFGTERKVKHLYSLKVRDTTQPIRVYSVINFLSRSVFFS